MIHIGRVIVLILPFLNFNKYTLFFFSDYHIGGTERVHLNILFALRSKKKLCFFTHKSINKALKKDYYTLAKCYDIHLVSIGIARYFLLGFFASLINRSKDVIVFIGSSAFGYQLVDLLDSKIKVYDLIHAINTQPMALGLLCAPRINKRILISNQVREYLIRKYKENDLPDTIKERIMVISNCVDVPVSKTKRDYSALKILYVGRPVEVKNPVLFAEIATNYNNNYEPLNFSMVGNFEIYKNSASFKACHLHLYGEIKDKKFLSELYDSHHLLLVTSSCEGFPMVIMEAMARGLVIISTNVGGIDEHIEHGKTGFLIGFTKKQKMIEDFIYTIRLLKEDEALLQNISDNAYQYALEHFSKEIFRQKYQNLFSLSH